MRCQASFRRKNMEKKVEQKKAEAMKTFLAKTGLAEFDWINKNKNKVALMLAVPVAVVMLLISCENGTSNGVTPTPNPHELCGDNPCDECAGKSEPTKPEPGKTDAELAEQFENFAVACFSGQCGEIHESLAGNEYHIGVEMIKSDFAGKNVVATGEALELGGKATALNLSSVAVSEKVHGRYAGSIEIAERTDLGEEVGSLLAISMDFDGLDKQ